MNNSPFNNTEVAFRAYSQKMLFESYAVFKSLAYPRLISLGTRLISTALHYKIPVEGLLKITLFKQFCGGESLQKCQPRIEWLAKYGVECILDYSVEGGEDETAFDKTMSELLNAIDFAAQTKTVPFAVFKLSGIARSSFLKKMTKHLSLNQSLENLTVDELEEWALLSQRIDQLCNRAFKKNIKIFIDAEETWIQGAIDYLAEKMMHKYNKNKAIVYNTVQMYRVDRLEYIKTCFSNAQAAKYKLGFKIVRGAYMEKERLYAKTNQLPDPIHPDKLSTDESFNKALEFCMEHVEEIAFCVASHNQYSHEKMLEMMQLKQLPKQHPHICFAQLFGMSENLTFNLAELGYKSAKYLPYGPLRSVLPYLFRRAEENTSIKGQAGRELTLIRQELKRRNTDKNKPVENLSTI